MALVAYTRADFRRAIDEFERAVPKMRCSHCTGFLNGQAFERLNQPGSALAVYKLYANLHEPRRCGDSASCTSRR